MNNPRALFFDTSILVACFNSNPTENKIADQAFEYADKYPHAARLTVSSCLVELFYKVRKTVAPKDVQTGLKALNIELCAIDDNMEQSLFDLYCAVAYKNEFDFADFCLCSTALMFNPVEILTMDKNDLSLAMARAHSVSPFKSAFHLRPFP